MDSPIDIPEVFVLKTFARGELIPRRELNNGYNLARRGRVVARDSSCGVNVLEKMDKFWPSAGGPVEFLHNVRLISWEAGILKLGGTERIRAYDTNKTTSVEQEWICYVGIAPPSTYEGR